MTKRAVTRSGPRAPDRISLPVFEPRAGVEHHDAFALANPSAGAKLLSRGPRGAPFGANVDAGSLRQRRGSRVDVLLGDGHGGASGLAQRAHAEEAADGRRDAQTVGAGLRMGPRFRRTRTPPARSRRLALD